MFSRRARKQNVPLRSLLKQRYNVNVLSLARFFLFGGRDMWFEVPLPFFLRDAAYGMGWERVAVGAVLAVRCGRPNCMQTRYYCCCDLWACPMHTAAAMYAYCSRSLLRALH